MSERTSTRASVNCSGLAKAGVPTNPPCVKPIASGFSTSAFATPKSITFTTISGTSAWPGLRRRLHPSRGGNQHQIRRFQIPVHQTLLFSCGQCAADLQGDVDGRERVERPGPANTRLQRFAFHQFHRAEALPVLFADTEMVNGRDIWMPQRCGRPCFAHEPFACFRSAFRPFRIDELQRNRPFAARCQPRDTSLPWRRGRVPTAIHCRVARSCRFPSRSVTEASQCFIRFFRVVESDA